MKKKRDKKDMPEALAYPPRALHRTYSQRGATATAAAIARRKRLAAHDKEKKHG